MEVVEIVLQTPRCFKSQGGFYIQFIPSRKCACVGDGHGRGRVSLDIAEPQVEHDAK